MSEAADIRVWAKAHGVKLGEVGRIPGNVRERYRASVNGDEDEIDLEEIDVGEEELAPPGEPETPAEPPAAPAPESRVPERRPQPQPRPRKRRGILQRDQPKPKRAKPARPRVTVENLVSSGWGLGALAVSQAPAFIPVARVLEMQSPWVGIVVEDKVKGTAADKWLQPFARMAETGGVIGAIVGLPLLVAIVTTQPQLFPVARPVMRLMLISTLELSGPAMEKVRQRAERLEASLNGVDIDGMLDSLWAGIPVAGEQSPMEEEHIRRARGE